jgi:DNA-binding MarR family transcriptional regulator
MSGHLKRLDAAGLIARTREADRRRVGLTITRDGTRVLRSVRQRRTAWLTRRLAGLTPGEREAIERAIEPLEKLLGGAE